MNTMNISEKEFKALLRHPDSTFYVKVTTQFSSFNIPAICVPQQDESGYWFYFISIIDTNAFKLKAGKYEFPVIIRLIINNKSVLGYNNLQVIVNDAEPLPNFTLGENYTELEIYYSLLPELSKFTCDINPIDVSTLGMIKYMETFGNPLFQKKMVRHRDAEKGVEVTMMNNDIITDSDVISEIIKNLF